MSEEIQTEGNSEATQQESSGERSEALYEVVDNQSTDQWENRQSVTDMAETEALENLYPEDSEPPVESVERQSETQPVNQAIAEDAYTVSQWNELGRTRELVQQVQSVGQNLQAELQRIQAAGGDIVKACGGNHAQAAALRADISEAKEFLKTKGAEAASSIQALQQDQASKQQAALFKQAPALEHEASRKALAGWLLDQGLSVSDVSAISPKQAATAWRLMQKDQGGEKPVRKLVIPKTRKSQKQNAADLTTEELFAATGNPKAQTLLYGLPRKKKPINNVLQTTDDAATILYGDAS